MVWEANMGILSSISISFHNRIKLIYDTDVHEHLYISQILCGSFREHYSVVSLAHV